MDKIHNISIIGSTGSIGTQTLEVVDNCKNIRVWGLSAYSDVDLLEEQIRKYKPKVACLVREDKAEELKIRVADTGTKIYSGESGLCEVSTVSEADTVVTAVVGISGLIPTIEAIKQHKNIALANNLKLWGNQITSETRRNFHFSTVYFPLALRFTTVGKSIVEPSLSRVLGSYLVFRVNPHPLRRKLSSYSN